MLYLDISSLEWYHWFTCILPIADVSFLSLAACSTCTPPPIRSYEVRASIYDPGLTHLSTHDGHGSTPGAGALLCLEGARAGLWPQGRRLGYGVDDGDGADRDRCMCWWWETGIQAVPTMSLVTSTSSSTNTDFDRRAPGSSLPGMHWVCLE